MTKGRVGKKLGIAEGGGDLATRGMGKAVVLSTFLTSVFSSKTGLHEPQLPGTREKVWSKEDVFLVKEDQSRNI